MKSPSAAVRGLDRSGIREVFDLANTIPGAIHLEMGEPDFATPAHVCEAAAQAAIDGYTKYTPNAGLPALREALAEKIVTRNGLDAGAERILVTPGAIASLFAAFLALCDKGDQVLIPDPAWPNYRMIAALQGLEVVRYPLRVEDGFLPSAELIEPLVSDGTKLILVNSPSNPTGVVTRGSHLEDLMALVSDKDLWVVSDEVYDEIYFDGPVAPSIASAGDPERVVTVWSLSKTYAMTGWRVGYALAPGELAPLMIKTQEPITACVNAPAQMGALAAVSGPQDCVVEMREAYRRRRDSTLGQLDSSGISYVTPAGAFYLWIDISDSGNDSTDFARALLLDQGVAVTPGQAFGPAGRGYVRVSLATDPGLLHEGVARLIEALRAAR
ncbi:MAG: pyridoxal phosphate-dependent aminotransferase [Acidimicrobiia bacterium]